MKHLKKNYQAAGRIKQILIKSNEKNNKKIRLQDIQFDEEKIRELFKKSKMKKKRKYYYNDYYNSDEGDVESDNSNEDGNDNKSKMRKLMPERKITLKWRKTWSNRHQKKQKKQKGIINYSWL